MSYEARVQRHKRFAAADWLQTCLVNTGREAGAGWVLALVDGIIERTHLLPQSEVEALTDAVQSSIEGADYITFGEPDTRDMAERAVNTVFEFLGLRGAEPGPPVYELGDPEASYGLSAFGGGYVVVRPPNESTSGFDTDS